MDQRAPLFSAAAGAMVTLMMPYTLTDELFLVEEIGPLALAVIFKEEDMALFPATMGWRQTTSSRLPLPRQRVSS